MIISKGALLTWIEEKSQIEQKLKSKSYKSWFEFKYDLDQLKSEYEVTL